ncbi:hypothetical protein LOK49_LG09G01509 [Camellia lanceoleosa]|uniref:Uncharacterized protein n=1 Tax=Camellia lanceoleosa TaxID=1840588 RepID=A0ACC0GKL5_9ERIC|nr:hypothetical protein LOK49_LG09G01509 [Camellia lanceoleosa]
MTSQMRIFWKQLIQLLQRGYDDWISDPAIPIVWKDVDGVLTCDPNIYSLAEPVPHLTFEEVAELAYFGAQVLHPQSMRPAREGDIPVRVKNSYNPKAPGTLITKTRDMSKAVLTSIVVKRNVTMLDIVSTHMFGQFGFLAKVNELFDIYSAFCPVIAFIAFLSFNDVHGRYSQSLKIWAYL